MKRLTLLLPLLLLAGCAIPFLPTALPHERPEDFSLEMYEGGGMMDQSTSWSIVGNQATYTDHYDQRDAVNTFTLSAAELDSIWLTLRQQRFDRITGYEVEAYDRGGTDIRISYNHNSISAADAGMTFLRGSSSKRFYAVSSMVVNLFDTRLDELKQPVEFSIDPTLLPDTQWVYLNGNVIYDVKTQSQLPQQLNLLPGEYELSFSVLVDSVATYNTLTLTVPNHRSTVTLMGPSHTITVSVQTE